MKSLLLEEVKHALQAELKTPSRKGVITGVKIDSRRVKTGDIFVAVVGENFDGHDFVEQAVSAGARAVVVSRNIPLSDAVRQSGVCVMRVDDTVKALGNLARFYRRSLGHCITVIAVTGSNGKTTTREMIYHVLSKSKKGHRSPSNYNNHIGVPMTMFGIEPNHEFVVVEIGSNAPGEVAALSQIVEPDVAVITQVGPSHLEGLGDVEGVSVEKVSIVAGLRDRGVVVCGVDHQATLDRVQSLGRHVITFGLDGHSDVCCRYVRHEPGSMRFETNDRCKVLLPVGGLHNVSNALAALAVVRRLGVSSQAFAAALTDFTNMQGRMGYSQVNGITIIDDSYNANPASMNAALQELASYSNARRRVFICGDMHELGEASAHYHHLLGRAIADSNVDFLLAVGAEAAVTATAALDAGMGWSQVQRSINSRRLARLVKSMIREGDVILVKGSRAMQMEKVVASLQRFRGMPDRKVVGGGIQAIKPARRRVAGKKLKV